MARKRVGKVTTIIPDSVGRRVYDVDISSILESLDEMEQIPKIVLEGIAEEVVALARQTLIEELAFAMSKQSEEAFPYEYRQHVLNVADSVPIFGSVSPYHFSVEFDWNELGTTEDLKKAFHQGAILADGTKLDGPYTGQALLNDDAEERHRFWEAVRRRDQKFENPKGSGWVKIEPNAWDNTVRKYIEIWGNKAPEWLYLQFGQERWSPKIKASSVIENFYGIFTIRAQSIWEQRLTTAVEDAQKGRVRLTKSLKELGPSGQPRRAGQFYFKGRR